MAKKRFILRVRDRAGNWTWFNPSEPMTMHQAKKLAVLNRCDGMTTQIWPEDEARDVFADELRQVQQSPANNNND